MDIRRIFQDQAYCTEACSRLMEKARPYLLKREELAEKDRRETVSCLYAKSGQSLGSFGYYHPGSFDTIVTKATRGRLYKEKPASYAFEYHLNEDKSFIAIHKGDLAKNPYWDAATYYFAEKDFDFGFSIARTKKANAAFNQSHMWHICSLTYVKKGATEADKEIISLDCIVTAQNAEVDYITAEYCDKIDENLFLCNKRELSISSLSKKITQFNYGVKVKLNMRGKLQAADGGSLSRIAVSTRKSIKEQTI